MPLQFSKFMRVQLLFLAIFGFLHPYLASAQIPKAKFSANQSVDYAQMQKQFQRLDSMSEFMQLQKAGLSDGGNMIHLMVVNKQKQFSPEPNTPNKNAVVLILNGIHPGESEGIDASILLLEALAKNPALIPDKVTMLIVPCYNVDGMINRKHFTRCGQNGPDEKGFRGSANNLDLNRDFLKADSKNTFVFYQIFQQWSPEVFMDTHTSNGADYQYTMTLITTQKQKLGGPAAEYLYGQMNPALFANMKKKGYEMAPYVNVFGKSPDESGYEVFLESPKFSTGYTSLFGTLGFVAETHMLKPFPARVLATYTLLGTLLEFAGVQSEKLVRTKQEQLAWMQEQTRYSSNFTVDRSVHKDLLFKGFELELIPSKLGDYQRHYYNRKRPFERMIPYYDSCKSTLELEIPKYVLIPQQWSRVIERLQANRVMHQSAGGTDSLWVNVAYLSKPTYAGAPYEGHFVHSNIHVSYKREKVKPHAGDWIVPLNQPAVFYLMETLSAETQDGFMCWNFFDPILNQKEGYSDYVFEDEALELLNQNPALQSAFVKWKTENPDKAKNGGEVLGFIYKYSPYQEKEYLRFPVYTY